MTKQILARGYLTHALTNENGEIYGLDSSQVIAFEVNPVELSHRFYWSEVFCEPGYTAKIIRKGSLVSGNPPSLLTELFERSKINLKKSTARGFYYISGHLSQYGGDFCKVLDQNFNCIAIVSGTRDVPGLIKVVKKDSDAYLCYSAERLEPINDEYVIVKPWHENEPVVSLLF